LEGLFLDTTTTPTSAETAFVLKHVRRLFPAKDSDKEPVATITPSSTSFLKIIDVPIMPDLPKDEWMTTTRHTLSKQFDKSLVGKLLAKNIKHVPRIMCNSPHADSCTAWVNIHDTMSGANALPLSVNLFTSAGSLVESSELNLILAPFSALGARSGAIICPSAAPKVCAVLFVAGPIARITTRRMSRSSKTNNTVSTARRLNVRRTITPLRTASVRSGKIVLIVTGSSASSNAIDIFFHFLFVTDFCFVCAVRRDFVKGKVY
jgi:hypothetical protein